MSRISSCRPHIIRSVFPRIKILASTPHLIIASITTHITELESQSLHDGEKGNQTQANRQSTYNRHHTKQHKEERKVQTNRPSNNAIPSSRPSRNNLLLQRNRRPRLSLPMVPLPLHHSLRRPDLLHRRAIHDVPQSDFLPRLRLGSTDPDNLQPAESESIRPECGEL